MPKVMIEMDMPKSCGECRFYFDDNRMGVNYCALTAEETAKKYGVSVHTLYYWNRLYGDEVAVVKAVELYHKRGCKWNKNC